MHRASRSFTYLLVLSVVLFAVYYVAAQVPSVCKGKPNLLAPYTGAPKLVSTVPNGKLYRIESDYKPDIYLIHMWGTAYEMGYAQGKLVGPQIQSLITDGYAWAESQVDQYLEFLPEVIRKAIEEAGLNAGLELTYWLTYAYTPQRFFDEMRGISDASGVPYMDLVRLNLFPELIRAQCSMLGAWGPAIKNTGGSLYQLRALDWSTNGPFQKTPAILVYHPTEANSYPFATIGWTGFVGSISGFSASPLAISQKVWISYNGTYSPMGYPWHFLLRDILQFDVDITSATNRIINAERTCSIWVGVGDGHLNQFRVFQYSHDYVKIYDDINFPAYADHPNFPGAQYVDKHVQPTSDPCLPALIKESYGSIDPTIIMRNITAEFQTGDMQICVYDFKSMVMYVSNAGPADATGKAVPAYDRRFVRVDMAAAFNEKRP